MTIQVVDTYRSCYNAVDPGEMLVSVANGVIRKVVSASGRRCSCSSL